jgi:uncharacterized membrane protein
MRKTWEHSVVVQAPVDQVFALVADFNKHPEWDKFTKRVEQTKPGDASGVGAEWKVYEQLGLFALGQGERDPKHLTGLAKREIRAVVPNEKVSWRTHPVPNVGIGADMTFEFAAAANGTQVTYRVDVDVPKLMEKVTKVILSNLDSRQQAQWTASLEQLKVVAEAHAPAYAATA